LGEFPTPVQRLEAFGGSRGFPELYIKRDDRSSSRYGGNKVRKLEYVLADAEMKGRKLLITIGATGSNQVLATGIFGGGMGFDVMGIMMDQPNAAYVRKNLLLDHHFGVEIKHASNIAVELLAFAYQYARTYVAGRRPYYVPGGASSPIGNVGFVNAAFELKRQVDEGLLPEPDYLITAAGSVGTIAGLELGCRLCGLKTKTIGVGVSFTFYSTPGRLARMVNDVNRLLRQHDPGVPKVHVSKEDLIVPNDYLGEKYGAFTELGVEAVREMKELEGIPLETTYTGKALGGGLDWLTQRGLQDKVVLFWNTYNSVDLTPVIADADYHDLPRSLHRYFEEPTQEELLSAG
jgi:D-cysteine desulfhydrase